MIVIREPQCDLDMPLRRRPDKLVQDIYYFRHGENLFGESVVGYIGLEGKEAEHYEHVLGEEKFYTSVYTNNFGERIDTGTPVRINGEIEYFLFVISPTAPLHNAIADVMFTVKIQTVALLLVTGFFVVGFSLKQRKKIKVDKLTMIGQLSSNIAHDIKNPLGAIMNSSIIIDKENENENEKNISRTEANQDLDKENITSGRGGSKLCPDDTFASKTGIHPEDSSGIHRIN